MSIQYDQIAAEYARHRRVHPGVLRELLDAGGLTPTCRALEVGCGTGNYIAEIAAATGCACHGIDPSAEMLERAKACPTRVQFARGRAERLEYPAGCFDLVFSVDVIHHVGDRPAYFSAARRVLAPGGRICTVTDSEEIIRQRRPLAAYFPETVELELRRYPPITTLRAEMEAAGFGRLTEKAVEFAYVLEDASAYRDKAFSSLHLISAEAHARGLTRLEADIRAGPVPCISRYLLLWGEREP